MAEIVPEMRWDTPLRLLGGLHYLALAEGIDPWSDVRSVLADLAVSDPAAFKVIAEQAKTALEQA